MKGWDGWVVAGAVGFLCGAAVVNMKKPGVFGTDLTHAEYYEFAASVPPPPVQNAGLFDEFIDRQYFSPGLVKKAFAGDAEAQFQLAECYNKSTATPEQRAEAAYWYLQSARQGHVVAMLILGEFYLQGIAVPQSDRDAVRWLYRSAKRGHTKAAWLLGECYLAGRGTKQNNPQAIRWLKKASVDVREARHRLRSLGLKPPPSKYIKDDA